MQRIIYIVGTASKKSGILPGFGGLLFFLFFFFFSPKLVFNYFNKYKEYSTKTTIKCITVGAYKYGID